MKDLFLHLCKGHKGLYFLPEALPRAPPGGNPSAAPVVPSASTPSLAATWGVAGQRPCGVGGGGAALSRTQLGTPRGVPICLVVPGVEVALPQLFSHSRRPSLAPPPPLRGGGWWEWT